jgi:penicillin-binding protein 1A
VIHGLIKGSILLVLIFAVALFAAFVYAYEEVKLDADKLINYKPEISSAIYDRNGQQLAYIFKERHRLYARYDQIPGYLIEALVAVEDTKFFEHGGVNPDAIIRAIIKDIQAGAFVEGASTITQQLIKNKLLSNEKKIVRKIKEAILSMKIENELTKEEILERYLNEVFFGNGYYGVRTAANGFFHKELQELTLKESAILVGLPNAPSALNPVRHYKRALARANSVLYRMKSLGWITEKMYIQAIKETPKVHDTTLTQNIAPYIVDEVQRRFQGRLGDIRTGGYRIYTTIDMAQQQIAKEAIVYAYGEAIKRYEEDIETSTLNAAMVSVESKTGDILTMVGGVDYRKSAFNRITQTTRQPGSAFKPFIYQTALDMGYNPASKLTDLARTFQYYKNGEMRIWSPKNYEGDFKGFITLREALIHSRNLATINLVYDIGVQTIRKRLELLDVPHIPRDMSIALGNLGLSPLKMAQIFSVFANEGHMIEPRLVSKIISREGAVIYETRPKEIANFTQPEQTYMMTSILRDIIRRGTGRKAAVEGIELAGKTGTTNDNVDAWFCGYSPTIETIVWFGRDNNRKIGRSATGGALAAPAFAYYYRELIKRYADIPRTFKAPNGVYEAMYEGHEELYTDTSPLPRTAASIAQEEREKYQRQLHEEDFYLPDADVAPDQPYGAPPLASWPPQQLREKNLDIFNDPFGEYIETPSAQRGDSADHNASGIPSDTVYFNSRGEVISKEQMEQSSLILGEVVELHPERNASLQDAASIMVDDSSDIKDHESPLILEQKPPENTAPEESGVLF